MKTKIVTYLLLLYAAFILTACEVNDPFDNRDYDTTPPAPPTGINVLNGDNRVDLSWNPGREDDIAGYNIYYSYSYNGKYTLIGSTQDNYFVDYDAANGETYYYAVEAYDYNGNISELSYDVIYSTPRPEGFNQAIFDYVNYPNMGGYSFTSYSAVPSDDETADFFYENYEGHYLFVKEDTEIQDMGPTIDIYDIEKAPLTGWSPTKDAAAIVGHTYVIWTWDNHFAKVRVKNITGDRIVFDWAFQLVEGERQLKPAVGSSERSHLETKRSGLRKAAK